MQLQDAPAIPARVQKVADAFRADYVALGASNAEAKPTRVLVTTGDEQSAGMLAAIVSRHPANVPVAVAFEGAHAVPAKPTATAIADAIAGAGLAGVSGVSFSEQGVQMGRRVPSLVRVHATDPTRAKLLDALLTPRVGLDPKNPRPETGVGLMVTTDPLPEPGTIIQVRPSTPSA